MDPQRFFRSVAARHARCFWLDGSGGRSWSGRQSLMGWLNEGDVSLSYDAANERVYRHTAGTTTVVGTDIFESLDEELRAGPSDARWVGYFGYACRRDLPAATGHLLPDAVWMRSPRVKVFDHGPAETLGSTQFVIDPRTLDAPSEHVRLDEQAYERAYAGVQEHLHSGNSYEVNLTYRLSVASDIPPLTAYENLRALNPAPYAGFIQHDVADARAWLLSSSPERFARIDADRTVITKPIKGTTPRGPSPSEDDRLRDRLATEAKFRAENLMIVDLLRHDLATVCEFGTVDVPELMTVESYETVHQLVSTVRGHLRSDVSAMEALRALFPAGSMTGAPKLRTMKIIEELESSARGLYAGAFGWVGADGRADLGVVIRSLFTTGDGSWSLGTGGGITVGSTLDEELSESTWKATRLLHALGHPTR